MIACLERAVVLGAGTMSAQLACLLAGAGTRVQLLDLDATVAAQGLERALRLRPSPRPSRPRPMLTSRIDVQVDGIVERDGFVYADLAPAQG